MINRICTVCVMDSSNPRVVFDDHGRCNCCQDAYARLSHEWWPDARGAAKMDALVDMLKIQGRGQDYDAMVGLSGGIDSAYLAHLMKTKYGLRLLAVHVDGGWNSAPAVRNIESIVRGLGIDLYTYVVEWQEMRDLQLAFLRAGVLNQDMPQDHAFFSTLYRTAAKFGLKHFLSGVNFSTESIVPPAWGYPSMDGRHVRGVHARFGQRPLKSFPIMDLPEFLWTTRVLKTPIKHKPLDFMAYDKQVAKEELLREYKWCDYGGKHTESRFTKFYQESYLPKKFHFDKRRLHMSSLIVSGQMTRDDALYELAQPIADPIQLERDARFVAKKLGITADDLNVLIETPPIPHEDYPNEQALHRRLTQLRTIVRRVVR